MRFNKIFASMLFVGASFSGNGWAESFQPFEVTDIQVEGLQRVALGAALLSLPVKVGDTVDEVKLQQAIKSLYGSTNFENISVSHEDGILFVTVKERPTISIISFEGNKDIKDEQLQESLDGSGVKAGESLDRTMLSGIEKGLQDFYYGVGKYGAKVEAQIINLPRNRVELKFKFTEGLAAEIRQINVVGNTVFSDSELISMIELKDYVAWWDLFGERRYQKQKLQADLETIKTYYHNQGYIRFEVTSTQVAMTPDRKGLYITINVDEGETYKVKEVNLIGDLMGREALMKGILPIKAGNMYNGADVTFTEEMYSKYLGRFGYAYPEVKTYPEIDDESKEVVLNINIKPGKRVYVRSINFTGNTVTKDEVLRRELRQMEGAWLNSAQIEQSKLRLNRLGYFETVDAETIQVPGSDDLVDVAIAVKEQPSGSFNAGVGYGTESGVSLQFGVEQNNFLGTGNQAGISINTNKYSRSANLSFTNPYFTKDGVSLGGSVYWNEFDANEANLERYKNQSYGVALNSGFPINESNRLNGGIGYRHNTISEISAYEQALRFYNVYRETDDANSDLSFDNFELNAGWYRSTLNRGTFPTDGSSQRLSGKMTVPGSDLQYFKTDFDTNFYFPLTPQHGFVFLARARLGYSNGYGQFNDNDQILPFWENYYSGGSSSLRGFKSNSVGPRSFYLYRGSEQCAPDVSGDGCSLPGDPNTIQVSQGRSIGGNAIATASFEMIVPTPFLDEAYTNSVRTSFFVDAGNVWDTEFDYDSYRTLPADQFIKLEDYSDPERIRASWGMSVQWLSPMGPMVFSLAWPLKEYEDDETEIFSFNIGKTF
ncbi:outer membrane protein assembly factor BamA [Shewanella psychromarinicola]|uniref:Outer membrane protein assembly factor BamA n=1 Tax=Shewanella psychromarinicola TaxID=2487742 RepID=A0A3N4E9K7_9GAMM|nr:outer membrane protein assembly factor BamA [Shewanella psychromarinicola]AZG36917.1 outer membrane protein assembly factor BamA [Shewanella psychromarinicola]MCL1082510.1 outer membrane protein assembly factor BamA [Shewanella psychromarinicola]RPA34773.1 outer membrane protein assembly factor BamA [Shewanella psychromarinicola]